MKYLFMFALLGILGIANLGYSQEIPDGMKEIMEQLQTDPDVEFGFNFAKNNNFIERSVQFKDWFVGLPIEFFKLNGKALEKADDKSEVSQVIEPNNIWLIPVRIKNSYTYKVKVLYENNMYKTYGCGEGVLGFHVWDKVREKYPEESGIRPIVIGMKHKFLYFPNKKDGKTIFHIRNPKWDDEISLFASSSLENMDESKKILKLWKKNWKQNKEKRERFLEKHPDIFRDNSGGAK